MSAAEINISAQIDKLAATGLTIKRERDEAQDALRDIIRGADMMLQMPGVLAPKGWVLGYIQEVKRVAQAGLQS